MTTPMIKDEWWPGWGAPPKPIYFYRLYHNDQGIPLFYSMEDVPGKYLEIDQATFALSPSNVRVVDGKLTYLKSPTVLKLHPSDVGTPCDPTNVSIVVKETQPHTKWTLK